jgi:hypothetical protein
MIHDLPLPLRLRNSLAKAGFTHPAGIRDWLADPSTMPGLEDGTIPGVGDTGMKALRDWADSQSAAPAVDAVPAGRWLSQLRPIDAPTVALEANLASGHAALARIGGSVEVSTSKDALSLTLEHDLLARLDALIDVVASLPHAKEFGILVDRKIVARMALIRGLDAMERAHSGKTGVEKVETKAKSADSGPEDAVPLPDPDAEVLDTPPGWSKCTPTEKIPIPEAVLHDYYSQNGWFRYWGMVDGTPIYFYWCPERRLQDLDPFPGSDKSGRKVAIQSTPWGPGHVVPVKWANS